MFEYFQLGGPIMYVLLICSIVAVGVFIERLIFLTKTKKEIDSLTDELQQMDYTNIELIDSKLRENQNNMLSRILQTIVDRINQPVESVKESVVRKANSEIPKLEKNITALGVIYNIAPMLGLLGTVLGLTITLQDLVSDPEKLLTGIYVSLITTIAGLIIAIPTHIAHSYLTSKVNKIVLSLENKTSYFVEELKK